MITKSILCLLCGKKWQRTRIFSIYNMDILIEENETFETQNKQWMRKYQKAKKTLVRLKKLLY